MKQFHWLKLLQIDFHGNFPEEESDLKIPNISMNFKWKHGFFREILRELRDI